MRRKRDVKKEKKGRKRMKSKGNSFIHKLVATYSCAMIRVASSSTVAKLDRSLELGWRPGRGRPWRSLAAMKAASTDWKVMHVKPSAAWGDLWERGRG